MSEDNQLRLVNGKFMRGDVEVPIEIGNSEQIALLKSLEREMSKREELAKEGKLHTNVYCTNITYDIVCEFKCVCGKMISESDERCYTDDADDLDLITWEADQIECPHCGRVYEIDESNNAKLIITNVR